jgi:uncharacterized membrane protein YfhO
MIAEKPMKPDERVLKYAEFAAKFNVAEQLDIPGRTLNIIQFYNLDAIFVIFSVIFLALYIVYKLVRLSICLLYKCVRRRDTKPKSD